MTKSLILKTEVIQTAEKIGVRHTSELYKISEFTISKWIKEFHSGEKNLPVKQSRKNQFHPLKMSEEDEQKIIELKGLHPKISAAGIIKELNLNYSVKTVLKKLKENIPVSVPKSECFTFDFYIKKTYLTKSFPQYYIILKQLKRNIVFIALTYERTELNIAIAADYFLSAFCELEENIHNALFRVNFKNFNTSGLKKTFFESIVTDKYKLVLEFDEKSKKIPFNESFVCQNEAELINNLYKWTTQINISGIDGSNLDKLFVLFCKPIIVDKYISAFIRQKENENLWKDVIDSGKINLQQYIDKKLQTADNYSSKYKYPLAVSELQDIITFFEVINSDLKTQVLYSIGSCYSKLHQLEKSEYYLNQAIDCGFNSNPIYWVKSLICISDISYKKNEYKTASFYLKQAEKKLKDIDDIGLKIKIRTRQALILNHSGFLVESLQILNKSLTTAKKNNLTEAFCEIAIILANIYNSNGKCDKAKKLALMALEKTDLTAYTSIKIHILCLLGSICIQQFLIDESEKYLSQALQIVEEFNYMHLFAEVYSNLAMLFNRKHEYIKAIDYAKKYLILAETQENSKRIIQAYSILSVSYKYLNENRKSLFYSLKAYRFSSKIKDIYNTSLLANNIVNDYIRMHLYKKALYFNKILHSFALKSDSPRLLSKSFCNFGTICYDQKKNDEALSYFCDMEIYALKINDDTNLAICYDMKARIYSEIKDYVKSLDNFDLAIKIIECTQNYYFLAELLFEKAKVLIKMNDKIQADDVLKKALSKAVLSKRDDLIADIHNLLK